MSALVQRLSRIGWSRTATGADHERVGIGAPGVGAFVIVVVVVAVLVGYQNGSYYQTVLGIAAAYLIAAVGYNLLFGYAGQFAFAQAGFMAVGAYVFAVLEANGTSQWAAAAAGLVAAGAFAAIVAVVVARTRDLYLALLTLACSEAVLVVVDLIPSTGGDDGIVAALSGSDAYLVAIVGAGVSLLLAQRLVRSRTGRAFNMVRTNERAALAMGARVSAVRITSFVVAGVLAGAGGIALAGALTYISPPNFSLDITLLLLTIVVVGGMGSLWGTLLGVVVITVVQQLIGDSAAAQKYVYAAVLFAIVALRPAGIASIARIWSRPLGDGERADPGQEEPRSTHVPVSPDAPLADAVVGRERGGSLLTVTGLTVTFGGVVALADVDLTIPACGRVAIVGPNGAGKTTLLNAISGLVRPSSGSLELDGGQNLRRLAPGRRASLGIARTFQDSALFTGAGMTVMDQLLCGAYARERYTLAAALLRTPGMLHCERRAAAEAQTLLSELELSHLAARRTDELSGPDRRLVDLARALMLRPRLLLLDEIAAGIPADAKERLAALLRERSEQRRMALIVIEHDLAFVRALAERVVVLTEGRLLADGPVEDVLDRADVMEAYIGVPA